MLSDIEKIDILVRGNSLEREEGETSILGRRPESPRYDTLIKQTFQSHSCSREAEFGSCAQNNHSVREFDTDSEFNRLSGELNQRISQEMGDYMSSVSSQIRKAIKEAINDRILAQVQATLRSGQGQIPERIWEIPARKQLFSSQEAI